MEIKGLINKLIPFSNVDGPGNRLVVFFQECNISCVYCHNPETLKKCINCMECIEGCKTKAITSVEGKINFNEKLCIECDNCIKTCRYNSSPKTREYTVSELMKVIEEYRPFIRGITVSGGEPTIQSEFIIELFKKSKELGLSCFVDTNGFFEKDKIAGLIQETDKFMVDIKAIDNLEKLCSCSLKNNIDNLKYLLEMNKVYEVRTVLILDYLDVENTVFKVAAILKDYPEVTYKLIRVHTSGLGDIQRDKIKDKIMTEGYVMGLAEKIKEIGVKQIEIIM